MARAKPKARPLAPAGGPSESPPEKPQRQRFIEAAREAGVDAETFEKGLAKLVPPKKK